MTNQLRYIGDRLDHANAVWHDARNSAEAPPLSYVQSFHIRRQHNGSVHIGFDSEAGWGMWATYLGLHWVKGPNEYNAHGDIDGVRFVLTCPQTQHDEAGAA